MGRVEGKTAIVTGAAAGLGRATASALVAEGAHVVLTDLQEEAGSAFAKELGDAASFVAQDVGEEDGWIRLMAKVEAERGGLDVLVNNAGIVVAHNIEEATLADWRRLHAVNCDGVFLGCKHAIPLMARSGGGSIVNLSSVAAMIGAPAFASYASSKGAVRALTKTVATHCMGAEYPIRCNSVHPGGIDTPMTRALAPALPDLSPLTQKLLLGSNSGEPLGEPNDIAQMVLFLSSDESRHINGAELVVDGGQTAR